MTADLVRALTWFSPSFPIGAYSYSHGLEAAIEAGFVRDRPTLTAWLTSILRQGAGWSDAILLAEAYRSPNPAELAELAEALAPTAELRLETLAQGRSFLIALSPWNVELPAFSGNGPALPVAVGTAAARLRLPLATTLTGYLHSFTANLVSAGVRLIPLGQTDGLRTLAALEPTVGETAAKAEAATLDDLGTACLMVEWCSFTHETQHTRLFRS